MKKVMWSGLAVIALLLALTVGASGQIVGGGGGGTSGGSVRITDGNDQALVNGSGELLVTCSGCSGTGVSHIDDAAFQAATDDIVPIGAKFDDTGTDSVDENDAGVLRMSANRVLFTQLRDAAGNERGANVNASNELLVAVSSIPSHAVTNAGTFATQVSSIAAGDNDIGNVDLEIAGTAIAVNNGTASAQTLRVTLASDGTGKIKLWDGTDDALVDGSGNLAVTCANCSGSGVSVLEDAAFVDGAAGTPAYAVRASTPANTSGTNGDFEPLQVNAGRLWTSTTLTDGTDTALIDASGRINVICDTCAGRPVAEDVASQDADVGTPVYTVRNDSVTGATSADGDYQPFKSDSAGRLYVTGSGGTFPITDSGGSITVDNNGTFAVQATLSGTNTVAGVAATDAAVSGNPVYVAGRASAAAPTDVSADGDVVPPWLLRSGASVVQQTYAGVLATTGNGASGTGVPRVTLANDSTGVLATVTTVGTVTTLSQLGGVALPIEDAAETAAGVGIYSMSVRRDTAASSAGTTGDNATINTDSLGRLWTTGSAVEDAAETAGGILNMAGTVRRDAAASSAGTDGDNATFNTDALGRLWVNCGTGCSGGTQYAEDAAHSSGDTGTMLLGVRNDAGTVLAGTTGDYIPLSMDSSGALRVVGSSGTTQYAEDIAHSSGDSTVFISGVRRDTTPSSSAGAAGDYTAFNIDANGRLYTQTVLYNSSGTELSLASDSTLDAAIGTSGPLMTGRGSTAVPTAMSADNDSTALWLDLNGRVHLKVETNEDTASANLDFGVPVFAIRDDTLDARSATEGDYEQLHLNANGALWAIDVNSAANLTSVQAIQAAVNVEDAAETAGDSLVMVGAVRRDAAASSSGTDGDNSNLSTDATGRLWVSGSVAEDAAASSGAVGLSVLGVRRDSLAASSGTDGDFETININARGAVWTAPTASTNGGADGKSYISLGSTEDEHAVKTSAGTLYSITATNTNASVRYLKCEDDTAGNTDPGTDTPEFRMAIPGATTGAGFSMTLPVGWSFANALTCWLVTGSADSDVAEVSAGEIMVFYSYK